MKANAFILVGLFSTLSWGNHCVMNQSDFNELKASFADELQADLIKVMSDKNIEVSNHLSNVFLYQKMEFDKDKKQLLGIEVTAPNQEYTAMASVELLSEKKSKSIPKLYNKLILSALSKIDCD